MNKHTPGPYHITQTVWTPDGLHIPWEVLQDCYWIHGEEKPLNFLGIALVTEKANANLFAAAPDLLRACNEALNWLAVFGEHCPVAFGGEAELSELLRAAIAKAKGEAVEVAV